MKKSTQNALLLAGSVAFTFFIVEAGSFVLRNVFEGDLSLQALTSRLTQNHDANGNAQSPLEANVSKVQDLPKTHKEFRLSRPDPYKDSAYFNWLIKEEWTEQHPECKSRTTHNGKGYDLKQEDTPACRGYTVKNGWRVTTNQPSNAEGTIYIYGGSTVENHEVPNEYTIASHLQRLLNNHGYDYLVQNRGFTSVVTNQQIDLLKREAIGSGDIVIFYDGGNNQWQSIANSRPNGTIISSNRELSLLHKIKEYASRLQSYKLLAFLRSDSQHKTSCDMLSSKMLENRANKGFSAYKKDLMDAKKIAKSRDAHFLHFMQPHLFSAEKPQRSAYERSLIEDYEGSQMVPMCSEKYLTIGSRVFSRIHPELLKSGINSVNLVSIFAIDDPRRPQGEHFLDWIHVTENGNNAIANQMYYQLLDSGLLAEKS